MVSSGFSEEFVGIDFNDKRLSKRVERIAEGLGRSCHASIPAAADGRAEMEAIYRFVDNPKVSPPKLTSQHRSRPSSGCVSATWCCLCKTRRNWTSRVPLSK